MNLRKDIRIKFDRNKKGMAIIVKLDDEFFAQLMKEDPREVILFFKQGTRDMCEMLEEEIYDDEEADEDEEDDEDDGDDEAEESDKGKSQNNDS